jgi:hypothetical protein
VSNDPINDFIIRMRREADAADFAALAERAIPRRRQRHGLLVLLRTRAAAIATFVLVAVGGLGGVSYAANGANPGDILYGLDRALERVGIGNGGSYERIAEAISLVSGGNPGQGLEHAAAVVPDEAGAGSALDEALAAVPALSEVPASAEVQEDVLALLTYLREHVGAIDGATVAELARAIAGQPEDTPAGPPEETPVGPPEDTPGGPPEDTPGNGPTTTSTSTSTTTTTTP